jgi:hypothetical protein
MNKQLTEHELQGLEHTNKVLSAHLEMMQALMKQIEEAVEVFIPLLRLYAGDIMTIRVGVASEIADILRSSGELRSLTKYTQDVINFTKAVETLQRTLTPDVTEQLKSILGSKS